MSVRETGARLAAVDFRTGGRRERGDGRRRRRGGRVARCHRDERVLLTETRRGTRAECKGCTGAASPRALGYSRTELATLGNVEKRRAFREVHKNPSKCLKHFCTPGRVWEGTISIRVRGAVEESHGSPYALQVLWFDAAAGAFLISHTAQGDEQLCHLMLKDDGREGVMALSFSDNETYCSGSIDGETGVIRGTVGQLVRAEEEDFSKNLILREIRLS